MRDDARRLDVGVRDVVTLLNRIPGVMTRASCQGTGAHTPRHAHAALAYIAFRHPLPLQLRDFFITRLGGLARVDDQGMYCRWPKSNRLFLSSLESATRLFLAGRTYQAERMVRWPLARLRARMARLVASGNASDLRLCLTCTALVTEPHLQGHRPLMLLHLPADLTHQWFADFIAQPHNALDSALVVRDGWVRLLARTHRGDFGAAFHRRWLRYRAQGIADLTTRQIRCGVDAARNDGVPIDFFYNRTHAVFTWDDAGAKPNAQN